MKKSLATASIGLLALGACDPQNPSTGGGAAVGAGAGALLGRALAGSGNQTEGALLGAAIGAGAGALIGQDLARQKAELDGSLSNSQIDVINTGSELIVRMPQDILFATDSASVNAGLRSDLGVLAANLTKNTGSSVTVIGHTDSTGDAAYNQSLSERRAQSVASILRANGVSANRVFTRGAGENEPIASNLTPEGRAQNRRVDILITPQG